MEDDIFVSKVRLKAMKLHGSGEYHSADTVWGYYLTGLQNINWVKGDWDTLCSKCTGRIDCLGEKAKVIVVDGRAGCPLFEDRDVLSRT